MQTVPISKVKDKLNEFADAVSLIQARWSNSECEARDRTHLDWEGSGVVIVLKTPNRSHSIDRFAACRGSDDPGRWLTTRGQLDAPRDSMPTSTQ